jgi:hypothetical protein
VRFVRSKLRAEVNSCKETAAEDTDIIQVVDQLQTSFVLCRL